MTDRRIASICSAALFVGAVGLGLAAADKAAATYSAAAGLARRRDQ